VNKLKSILKKDMSPLAFWVLTACVIAAKLVLAHYQQIYVWVGGAPIDDELMYEAALSITKGEWLGEYNYLTLSKQMFFAVWLALCNAVGLPYLMAGQLLLCGARVFMTGTVEVGTYAASLLHSGNAKMLRYAIHCTQEEMLAIAAQNRFSRIVAYRSDYAPTQDTYEI